MAQFSLSPSVEIKELDQTSVIPSVSTTIGAFAGTFEWGPAFKRMNVDNDISLIRIFGRPTENNFVDWYSASNYLAYSNFLKLVRVVDTTVAKNAVNYGSAVYVANDDDFEMNPTQNSASKLTARYPGALGNSLLVSFVDNAGFDTWEYKGYFSSSSAAKTSTKIFNIGRTGTFESASNVITDINTSGLYAGMTISDGSAPIISNNTQITSGNTTVVLATALSITVGMEVYGDGIVDGTTVSGWNSGTKTVTLSAAPTKTKLSDLTFFDNTVAAFIPANTTVSEIVNSSSIRINKVTSGAGTAANLFFHDVKTITSYPGQPDTSLASENASGSNDELHIVIVDKDGKFSGQAGTVLERFTALSKASNSIGTDGVSNFFVDVLNRSSRYVYIADPQLFYTTGSDLISTDFANISRKIMGLTNTSGSANIVLPAGITTASIKPGMKVSGTGIPVGALVLSITNATTFVLSANTTQNVSELTISNSALYYEFTGGVDSFVVSDTQRIAGFAMFQDQEEVDVNLVFGGDCSENIADFLIDNIGEYRKDCMVFVSPPKSAVVGNNLDPLDAVKDFRNKINSSSYAVMDTGWKYQYDRYNDKYRWIPLNPDVAGLVAQTERQADAWWSPAGFNRGFIKNVVKLAWNPSSKADRDDLYQVGVNPVVSFPSMGTVLYGDKTLLAKPSAFDRINVRRLFIVLEKAIATYSKFILFEFNDPITRSRFVNTVVPYLRNIQGRRGIMDFRVVADESVNTGEVIDSNAFVANIMIKPTRSINFIQLNFVAMNSAASFTETVI